VDDWRDVLYGGGPKNLDGADLARAYGIYFGAVEVWAGENSIHSVETPFGLGDLYPQRRVPPAPGTPGYDALMPPPFPPPPQPQGPSLPPTPDGDKDAR